MAGPAILIKEQLEKYFGNGYIFETAENGEEGLELIEELLEDEIKILIIVSDCLQ
jgi:hypothetical protein